MPAGGNFEFLPTKWCRFLHISNEMGCVWGGWKKKNLAVRPKIFYLTVQLGGGEGVGVEAGERLKPRLNSLPAMSYILKFVRYLLKYIRYLLTYIIMISTKI